MCSNNDSYIFSFFFCLETVNYCYGINIVQLTTASTDIIDRIIGHIFKDISDPGVGAQRLAWYVSNIICNSDILI